MSFKGIIKTFESPRVLVTQSTKFKGIFYNLAKILMSFLFHGNGVLGRCTIESQKADLDPHANGRFIWFSSHS